MTDGWKDRLASALSPLPDEAGGSTIVLATSGSPPALALLSTGDVLVTGEVVRVGLWAGSSAAARLEGSFSLLVPAGDVALRVEATDAHAEEHGHVALVEGRLREVRPTTEPPWVPILRFVPEDPADPRVSDHLEYWAAVRQWLEGDGTPPTPPGGP